MRRELEAALQLARTLPRDEIPYLLGELETIRTFALARISAPPLETKPDELLDVHQAAQRLHVSPLYLYRRSQRFPFVRRIGRKVLFSSAGLDSYLRKQGN